MFDRPALDAPDDDTSPRAALSAVLTITSGEGAPALDTGVLTITFDKSVPAISETGYDLSAISGTLIAANREWDVSDVDIENSGLTLVISNITVTDTIVGNGTLTNGTPTAYATNDNKTTIAFETDDSTFPLLQDVSAMAVSLTGDAVPVVCKLEWDSGESLWNQITKFSRDTGDVFVEDQTLLNFWVTNRQANIASSFTILASNANSAAISSDADLVTSGGNSGLQDNGAHADQVVFTSNAAVTDATAAIIPSFTFPLHIVGGALCVPAANAALNVTAEFCTIQMSRAMAAFVTPDDSFSAWLSNKFYSFTGYVSVESTTMILAGALDEGADTHADVLVYSGLNADMLDDQSRPIPPFERTVAGTTTAMTRNLGAPTATLATSTREYSGLQLNAAGTTFYLVDDGGILASLPRAGGSDTELINGLGDTEGVALVAGRSDYIYILKEGADGALGSILEYRISTDAITRTLTFPVEMQVGSGNNGDEGLAYVEPTDPNVGGYFVVGHQATGNLYWLDPGDFSGTALAWVGMTTCNFMDNDAASVEALQDGTLMIFNDVDDKVYRIRLTSDIVGATLNTGDARIIEIITVPEVGGVDAEAFCMARTWAGSGVRETHKFIVGEDNGGGASHVYEYSGALAVYGLLT